MSIFSCVTSAALTKSFFRENVGSVCITGVSFVGVEGLLFDGGSFGDVVTWRTFLKIKIPAILPTTIAATKMIATIFENPFIINHLLLL